MTQLEAIYREALENIKNTLDGCGMRQDEEMPLSELLLLRVAREALSAQGEQGTQTYEEARICPDCDGYGSLGHAPDGRLISCESCGGHEDSIGTGVIKAVISPTPTAQEPPTETQERCQPRAGTGVVALSAYVEGVSKLAHGMIAVFNNMKCRVLWRNNERPWQNEVFLLGLPGGLVVWATADEIKWV